ncbi:MULTISPECIES: hypothetical protein [unclassified Brevundimonas]|uniref:hypothetical protein n=1 Tax=unclassified Brevundimonas TaxID=2622653 RepID=UPI000CFD7298|nr:MULTISPECIES: hypothetical protein [unclassified Brevundimonas]PRA35943.1 hypothetical protein CQ024_00945 [Brevundimonas sp. MYb27]PQZ84434.1 hypothetical protein CQ026_01125 [Brevundimonas sp. MYb31]PRB17669.1 hypothetical protein CQ039_01125 [Brevundimonas sp. MYb52]PRB38040.1 hypothetical protein CQ035_01125 [Brevundimonas sp. MYb46]PRB56178.1 hypothetical protein CQ028_01805 [Brevundimonas sp. MYb33]
MSISIVSHQTISRIVGFAAGQADLVPVGWSSNDLYRKLREINERTFLARYPQAELEAGSSEPDIPGDAADFTKLVRALGDYEHNSDLSGERQLAALLVSLMSRDDR